YQRLLLPEGQVYVAGDQVSYLSGWQEGAVLSAHHAINGIAGIEAPAPRALETPSMRKPPSISRRTKGKGALASSPAEQGASRSRAGGGDAACSAAGTAA